MLRSNIEVTVVKEFKFESSHKLVNYVGACANWHGHSYKLQVAVSGIPSDEQGLTTDFKNLKSIVNSEVIEKCDHADLNTVMLEDFSMQGNSTCENMIIAFWYALDHEIRDQLDCTLEWIKLWETDTSHAILTRSQVYKSIGE